MHRSVYHSKVYDSQSIQAWERRWFAQRNSSLGLMQQAAWTIAQNLNKQFLAKKINHIAVWCGQGNNAGDGYYIAAFLKQQGFKVTMFATELGHSEDLQQAFHYAQSQKVDTQTIDYLLSEHEINQDLPIFDCHIDALFGIGLNRMLDQKWQNIIHLYNLQTGFKVSVDIPSGIHADTGQALPCSTEADQTFTLLGYKAGLFTGQGKEYVGKLHLVSLIPIDAELKPLAYLSPERIALPKRKAFGHKGSYGHVLVVGGHADMGGGSHYVC